MPRISRLIAFAFLATLATSKVAFAQHDEPSEPRLSWFGNARFRPESTIGDPSVPDRFRFRLRLRLGATYRLSDQFTVGGRLSTGNQDNPNSPWRDLGQLFDQFPLRVDRLYLAWKPSAQFDAAVGKVAHPFSFNPIYGELVWDQDIQPEGAVGRYMLRADDDRWAVGVVAGAFVLLEQPAAEDASAIVAQGNGELQLGDDARLRVSVGLHDYRDLTPAATAGLLSRNRGNAVEDTNGDGRPDRFTSAFRLLDYELGVRWTGLGKPLLVNTQYVRNHRAAISQNDGWAAGVAMGELLAPRDWRIHYQYQRIGRDGVFSPFVQDDFVYATAFRGHTGGFAYRAAPGVDLHAWVLIARPEQPDASTLRDYQWRLRFDATFGFP